MLLSSYFRTKVLSYFRTTEASNNKYKAPSKVDRYRLRSLFVRSFVRITVVVVVGQITSCSSYRGYESTFESTFFTRYNSSFGLQSIVMKGCDVIVDLLISLGVDTYFVLTGGAIVPFIDAVGRRNNETTLVAFQHEQAAAMAAEGYWRESGRLPAVLVTSGPGIQNVLNALCGCFYDSVPLLVISGQVNTSESLDAISSRPRQRGFQEMPVVESFGHFCKYAKKIKYVHDLFGHEIFDVFTTAYEAATTPRFGPVLIDLPVNIQMCEVFTELERPVPFNQKDVLKKRVNSHAQAKCEKVLDLLLSAARPLVVFGAGVRASGSRDLAHEFIDQFKIPFCTSWGAKDLFDDANSNNCGCIGVYGSRAANFAVQNCDVLWILGSRLDTRQTGGNLARFAATAKKVMVDIDSEEIGKLVEKGCQIHFPIVLELKLFFCTVLSRKNTFDSGRETKLSTWTKKTQEWKATYANAAVDSQKKYELNGDIPCVLNAYLFLERLDAKLPVNTTVVPDTGAALCWTMQSLKVKSGMRVYANLGNSSMGFAFPCCLGSAFGSKNPVVCISGDGGFQLNIQELKTAVDYNLPVKIFVLNNSGYGIITQFQDSYFEQRYYATRFTPIDFVSIAKGYGMSAIRISELTDIDIVLEKVFAYEGPILVDVCIQATQKIYPKLEFGNSLEHMTPFIPLHELENIMITEVATRIEPKGWVRV